MENPLDRGRLFNAEDLRAGGRGVWDPSEPSEVDQGSEGMDQGSEGMDQGSEQDLLVVMGIRFCVRHGRGIGFMFIDLILCGAEVRNPQMSEFMGGVERSSYGFGSGRAVIPGGAGPGRTRSEGEGPIGDGAGIACGSGRGVRYPGKLWIHVY